MEIRVVERLSGRAWRDRILAHYGSRENLARLARRRKNPEAWNDLMDLRLLEERPERLDEEFRVTTIGVLSPEDLDRLTPQRLRLLSRIASSKRPLNITELARALRRDKKNVSEDVRVLEGLGLVETRREGREKIAETPGREVSIILTEPAEA